MYPAAPRPAAPPRSQHFPATPPGGAAKGHCEGRGLTGGRGGGACRRGDAAGRASAGRRGPAARSGTAAMYRALYSFRSAEPNSLPFAAGETFLLLERSNQHWWLVTRAGSGETGYAPASYLQRLQVGRGRRARGAV